MNRCLSRRGIASLVLAGLVLCAATYVLADKYPSKPVRVVVPFAAGGGNDVVARLMAERLAPLLGQPFVVENRPGAGGNTGTDLVAKAAPDGYTLLYVSNTVVMNPYLYEKLPFDVQKDLQPVGLLVTAPILVLVNPSAAIQSIGDLLKQGKERPGQLSYATPGNGTPHHFAMELLKARSGANLLHVPYKGAAPAVTDVLGGHVPVLVATPSSVVDFISSGRLRLLATMEPARTSAFPNVPAIAEIVPDFEVSIWHGLMLPANPPAEVVETLSAAAKRIVAEPEFRKKLAPTGFAPKYEPPQTMKERIVADLKTWKKVAEDAGIVAE